MSRVFSRRESTKLIPENSTLPEPAENDQGRKQSHQRDAQTNEFQDTGFLGYCHLHLGKKLKTRGMKVTSSLHLSLVVLIYLAVEIIVVDSVVKSQHLRR